MSLFLSKLSFKKDRKTKSQSTETISNKKNKNLFALIGKSIKLFKESKKRGSISKKEHRAVDASSGELANLLDSYDECSSYGFTPVEETHSVAADERKMCLDDKENCVPHRAELQKEHTKDYTTSNTTSQILTTLKIGLTRNLTKSNTLRSSTKYFSRAAFAACFSPKSNLKGNEVSTSVGDSSDPADHITSNHSCSTLVTNSSNIMDSSLQLQDPNLTTDTSSSSIASFLNLCKNSHSNICSENSSSPQKDLSNIVVPPLHNSRVHKEALALSEWPPNHRNILYGLGSQRRKSYEAFKRITINSRKLSVIMEEEEIEESYSGEEHHNKRKHEDAIGPTLLKYRASADEDNLIDNEGNYCDSSNYPFASFTPIIRDTEKDEDIFSHTKSITRQKNVNRHESQHAEDDMIEEEQNAAIASNNSKTQIHIGRLGETYESENSRLMEDIGDGSWGDLNDEAQSLPVKISFSSSQKETTYDEEKRSNSHCNSMLNLQNEEKILENGGYILFSSDGERQSEQDENGCETLIQREGSQEFVNSVNVNGNMIIKKTEFFSDDENVSQTRRQSDTSHEDNSCFSTDDETWNGDTQDSGIHEELPDATKVCNNMAKSTFDIDDEDKKLTLSYITDLDGDKIKEEDEKKPGYESGAGDKSVAASPTYMHDDKEKVKLFLESLSAKKAFSLSDEESLDCSPKEEESETGDIYSQAEAVGVDERAAKPSDLFPRHKLDAIVELDKASLDNKEYGMEEEANKIVFGNCYTPIEMDEEIEMNGTDDGDDATSTGSSDQERDTEVGSCLTSMDDSISIEGIDELLTGMSSETEQDEAQTIYSDSSFYSSLYSDDSSIYPLGSCFFRQAEIESFLNYGTTVYTFKEPCNAKSNSESKIRFNQFAELVIFDNEAELREEVTMPKEIRHTEKKSILKCPTCPFSEFSLDMIERDECVPHVSLKHEEANELRDRQVRSYYLEEFV